MGDTITVIRGDDVVIDIELLDDNGDALDLTDTVITFTVKKRLESGEAVIVKEVSEFDDPASGVASINLSNTETDITPGSYLWDIQIEIDGAISSTDYGIFRIKPDITLAS
jgi:hypothetical protein